MMAQSFDFFILFIAYTGSAKTRYFPEARYFFKKNLETSMLAKPWFIFSEVLHVFFLAISTKVCGENLFHFVSIYFVSLHRKTSGKSHSVKVTTSSP